MRVGIVAYLINTLHLLRMNEKSQLNLFCFVQAHYLTERLYDIDLSLLTRKDINEVAMIHFTYRRKSVRVWSFVISYQFSNSKIVVS